MIKVKKVHIEGMHKVDKADYTFTDVNYLTGHNGAGKSTVLEAIQLGLLGYIPGKGKKNDAIFRHANTHTMRVSLTIDVGGNEVTIDRMWNNTSKGIKSDVMISPSVYDESSLRSWVDEIEMPIFNFNELVGLTANTLKDWFIGFMPKAQVTVDWASELTSSVKETPYFNQDLLDTVLLQTNTLASSGLEKVRDMNTYLKQLLSFKKSELSRTANTIQSLVYYDGDVELLDEQELLKESFELGERWAQVNKWKSAESTNKSIDYQLSSLYTPADSAEDDPEYVELINSQSDTEANIKKLNDELSKLSKELDSIRVDIAEKERVINSDGVCPYSYSKCTSIVELSAKYQSDVAELKRRGADVSKQVNEIETTLSELTKAHYSAKYKLNEIVNKYSQKAQLESMRVPEPDIDKSWIDIDFNSLIADINDKLTKVRANQKYTQLTDEFTRTKYRIELDIECLNIWIKLTGANGLQSKLMTDPFNKFASIIDNYLKYTMGSDTNAAFNVTEKANSFSMGINRNGKYIPFDLLSSGEKCLYTLALMITVCMSSNSELNLVMIDDLLDHLDNSNIDNLFESLSNLSDMQFIFAGVKETNSIIPNIIKIS